MEGGEGRDLGCQKIMDKTFEAHVKLTPELGRTDLLFHPVFVDVESTTNFARRVADHYSARTNQTLEEREASPIIHLKKLNNWFYARRGDVVVDLGCGKGGDLMKEKANISYYVGIDIAEGSIEDCRTCYNGDADHHLCHKKFSFPARLLCADCFEARLDKVLADESPFDICSCQVSHVFVVDCHILELWYDLVLVFAKNNHMFVEEYLKKLDFVELMRKIGSLGDGNQDEKGNRI